MQGGHLRAVLLLALLAACQTTPELGMTPAQVEAIWGVPDRSFGPQRASWENWPTTECVDYWLEEDRVRCVVYLLWGYEPGFGWEATQIHIERRRRWTSERPSGWSG